jgi:predicted lipid-binding transport protein (Tim44 family)
MLKLSTFSLSAALVRCLLIVLLLAVRLSAAAQAPAWQSAQAVAAATAGAASDYSNVTATTVDAARNVYLAGAFTNTHAH